MRVTCATCLDAIVSTSNISCAPCGHVFHTNCLQQWLETGRRNCPECRKRCLQKEMRRLYLNQGHDDTVTDPFELEARLDDVKENLRVAESERKKAVDEKAIVEAKLTALNCDLKESEEKRKKLTKENQKLKNEKTMLKMYSRSVEKLEKENIDLNTQLEAFQTIKAVLEDSHDQVNNRLQEIGDFSPACTQMVQIVLMLKKELGKGNTEVDNLMRQLRGSESERSSLAKKLSEYKRRLKTKEDEATNLRAQVDEAEIEKTNLKKQLESRLNQMEDGSKSMSEQKTSDLRRLVQESPAPLLSSSKGNKSLFEDTTMLLTSPQESTDSRRDALRECNSVFANMNILKRSTSALARRDKTIGSRLAFDGMGGRAKLDEFPDPKRFKPTSKPLKKSPSLQRPKEGNRQRKSPQKENKKRTTMDRFFNLATP